MPFKLFGQCNNLNSNKKNLIVNADFQSGYSGFKSYNINDIQIQVEDIQNFKNCSNNNEHNKVLYLDESVSSNAVLWNQIITVKPYHNYFFSFEFSSLKYTETPEVRIIINGRQVGSALELAKNACFWLRNSYEWQSDENSTIEISIVKGDNSKKDVLFDNFKLYECESYKKNEDLNLSEKLIESKPTNTDDIKISFSKSVVYLADDNVFFDAGSFKLTKYSFDYLYLCLNYLRNNPDVHADLTGHTDSLGVADHNEILGLKRAQEIRRFFTGRGIDYRRVHCNTKGGSEPLKDNSNDTNRAMNRRVFVHFYKPK